jgi:transcriptional regulator with XRE-family HTH domain
MPTNLNNFIEQIKNTRTIKELNQEDCAQILDISAQNYADFEQGNAHLSLPELELLAKYLGLSLQSLTASDTQANTSAFKILHKSVRPRYKTLRQKMILSKLEADRSAKAITMTELHFATGIPLEKLLAYQKESSPVPIDHLIKMSDALNLPMQRLLNHENITQIILEPENETDHWHPEFHGEKQGRDHEQSYQNLLNAIKSMPMKEQAQIAKIVLNFFKNQ